MAFKKIRSIRLSYATQGQIYFKLLNYRSQPKKLQEKIDRLIVEAAGGEDAYVKALRRWLLFGERWDVVQRECFVHPNTLCMMRKKIYENWGK